MNTLRNVLTVLFMALGAISVSAAEPAHDHQHGAPAPATAANTAPVAVQNDEAAVMARMHARMGEIMREADGARRMQLMELQMRDRALLSEANPNGEACQMMQGGKPGMGGMSMSGQPGMMGPRGGMMGSGEHCSHASGAMSCPKHDAMQKRLKAVEQRLDALERAAKSATQPAAK